MFSKLNRHSDKWPNNANTWVDLCCSCFRTIAWLEREHKCYLWKIFGVTYLDPWKLSWVTWDPSRLNAAQRTHGLHATLYYSLHFWKALLGKEIGRTDEPDRNRRNEKIQNEHATAIFTRSLLARDLEFGLSISVRNLEAIWSLWWSLKDLGAIFTKSYWNKLECEKSLILFKVPGVGRASGERQSGKRENASFLLWPQSQFG